ncbi:MAG: c-type cytochrome domain-containing protein [Pirellulaceae bacterium]
MQRFVSLLATVRAWTVVALVAVTSLASASAQIPVAEVEHPEPVDFATEILPLLQRNCLACHSSSVAEGELVLETPDAMLQGGNEGPAIVPGNAEESYLFQLASHQSEPVMPPAGNKANAANLTSQELGLLKLWIDQGATKGSLGTINVAFEPLPPGVHPVYSVAFSPDSRTVAAGRANQVFLYDVPTRRSLGRLTDPALLEQGLYERPGVADVDIVQSLAFSPAGDRIAVGGYRSVKIWRRQLPGVQQTVPLPSAIKTIASSADGGTIAVLHEPNQLSIVATSDGAVKATIDLGEGEVTRLAVSDDGQRIAGISAAGLTEWRSVDGAWQATAQAPLEPAGVLLTYVSTRDVWVVAGADHRLRLFGPPPAADSAEGTAWGPGAVLEGHGQGVTALAISVAPAELISGDQSGQTILWNLENNSQLRSVNHGSAVRAIAADVAAKRIVTLGDGRTARAWNVDDGQQVGTNDGDWDLQLASAQSQQAVALANRMVDLANQDLKAAQDQKTAEETNLNAAKEAVTKATEDVAAKQAAYDPLGAARDQAQTALDAANAKVTEIEAAIAAAEAERAAAEAKVNELNERVQALAQDPAQAEALATAQQELTAAQAVLEAAAKKKTETEATLPPAQEEQKKAQEAFTAAEAPAKKAMDELVAAQRTLEGATRTADRAAEALQRATDAIPGREAQVAERQQLKATREAEANQANEQFGAQSSVFVAARGLAGAGTLVALTADGLWTGISTAAASPLFAEHVCPADAAPSAEIAHADAQGRVWVARGNELQAVGTSSEWTWERTIGDYRGESPFVDRVTSLDFSPNGAQLAVAGGVPSRSGTISIINVETGEVAQEFNEPHSDVVLCVRFSPEGDKIASAGTDRFMRTFVAETGEHLKNFEGHTHHVQSVDWSSDGRTLVTTGSDSVVKVWNALTGEQVRTIQGFGKEVTGVQFVGLTTQVAASCGDRNVHVKNSAEGGNVRQLGGFADYVYCVAVSWDGKQFAAGGLDGQVRVWKDDGTLLAEFANPTE